MHAVAIVRTRGEVMARGARNEEFPVPDKLCRAHLEKVAASATFARAGQLRALLEWLGSRSLAPTALPPTEREIAEAVLRRADFDPQADSLVRKEISRLRQKLAQYYAREGARDRVHIHCRGGYLLRFFWADRHIETHGALPCILILPFRSDAELSRHSLVLAEELAVRLGELGRAELVSPTTAMSYLGRVGDIRSFASECGADYVVEGSLESGGDHLRTTLWFVDGHTGRTERPGRFEAENPGELARLATLWLQEQVVRFFE
jgi:TolB-like protein